MEHLFYRLESPAPGETSSSLKTTSYVYKLWSPSFFKLFPPGVSLLPFGIWWGFHYARVFKNDEYSILIVYDENTLIHRSCVFPGYFRFPFMAKGDLQIGDTWTHPAYRGQGIASFAIHMIVGMKAKVGRTFWYLVEEDNVPSIRVVEKNGFVKIGEGVRTKKFGLRLLGTFEMLTSSD